MWRQRPGNLLLFIIKGLLHGVDRLIERNAGLVEAALALDPSAVP